MEAWHFAMPGVRPGDDLGTFPTEMSNIEGKYEVYAGRRLLDALGHAIGPVVCRVRRSGKHLQCLWTANADAVLWRFARRCALDVVDLWDAPDSVVRYLRTGRDPLRETAVAAAMEVVSREVKNSPGPKSEALRPPSWDAMWSAVTAMRGADSESTRAAMSAVLHSAGARARVVTRSGPWDPVWCEAWDRAMGRQERRLTQMVARLPRDQ